MDLAINVINREEKIGPVLYRTASYAIPYRDCYCTVVRYRYPLKKNFILSLILSDKNKKNNKNNNSSSNNNNNNKKKKEKYNINNNNNNNNNNYYYYYTINIE